MTHDIKLLRFVELVYISNALLFLIVYSAVRVASRVTHRAANNKLYLLVNDLFILWLLLKKGAFMFTYANIWISYVPYV